MLVLARFLCWHKESARKWRGGEVSGYLYLQSDTDNTAGIDDQWYDTIALIDRSLMDQKVDYLKWHNTQQMF